MTIDVPFDNAQQLVEAHVKFAHQAVAANAGPAIMKAEKLVRPSLMMVSLTKKPMSISSTAGLRIKPKPT